MRKNVFQVAIWVGTDAQHQSLMIAIIRQVIKDAPLDPLYRHIELFRHAHRIADRPAFLGALVNHQRINRAPSGTHRFDNRPVTIQEFRHHTRALTPSNRVL